MSQMQNSVYFAGLDIGGSTIKSMLVDAAGKRVGPLVEGPSDVDRGYLETFRQLKGSLERLVSQADLTLDAVAGIGLDVPAPCSDGVIWGKANLSADWVGVDIRKAFSEAVGKPVVMTNDGNAAAFGEYLLRPNLQAGLLFVAPGTGLGGGLILPGGIPYEGANGLAMELGAIIVPFREGARMPADANGRVGCLEAWVSLVAIRRQLERKLSTRRYRNHPLNDKAISLREKAFRLREYAEKGDALALEIFRKQANVLGYALGDQVSVLDPGLIVVGGGLAESGFRDWYMQEIRQGFRERASAFYQNSPLAPHEPTTQIEWAIGGDAAAALGVARQALDVWENGQSK